MVQIIPWTAAFVGLIVAACGAVLAMHGFDQRHSNCVARLGYVAVTVGLTVAVMTSMVNYGVDFMRGMSKIASETVASAQPHVEKDPR